jgi:hypothetical protein
MHLLKRLPGRRGELLFYLLVFTGFYAVVWVMNYQRLPAMAGSLALMALELLLPLAAGLLVAGSLAGDPALDLLLSAHRPAWQVMGERLLIVGGLWMAIGSGALLLAHQWGVDLPHEGLDQIFIWLSPLLFLMGLANAAALLRGRKMDGVLAVMGAVGAALITLPRIPALCSSVSPCWWWLANPLMTMGDAGDSIWPLNRLLWLALGAALLVASLKLAQREEQILQPAGEE